MKTKECYYVKRGVPFEEQLLIYRFVDGKLYYSSTVCANSSGWVIDFKVPIDYTRIPTWQAKAYWPNITKV